MKKISFSFLLLVAFSPAVAAAYSYSCQTDFLTIDNISRILFYFFIVFGTVLFMLPLKIVERRLKIRTPLKYVFIGSIYYGSSMALLTFFLVTLVNNLWFVFDPGTHFEFEVILISLFVLILISIIGYAAAAIPRDYAYARSWRAVFAGGWIPLLVVALLVFWGVATFAQVSIDFPGAEEIERVCGGYLDGPRYGFAYVGYALILLILDTVFFRWLLTHLTRKKIKSNETK